MIRILHENNDINVNTAEKIYQDERKRINDLAKLTINDTIEKIYKLITPIVNEVTDEYVPKYYLTKNLENLEIPDDEEDKQELFNGIDKLSKTNNDAILNKLNDALYDILKEN